jgi:molybdopterin converting factor subunit 1
VTITLRLFASARVLAGFSEKALQFGDSATTEDIWDYLVGQCDEFRSWRPSVRFAVNARYVIGPTALQDGDEVAIIPPVSGG